MQRRKRPVSPLTPDEAHAMVVQIRRDLFDTQTNRALRALREIREVLDRAKPADFNPSYDSIGSMESIARELTHVADRLLSRGEYAK